MQVYGHRTFPLDLQAFLHAFARGLEHAPRPTAHDQIAERLVDFAEAESAVADALCAERDDEWPDLQPWREALHLLADQFCATAAARTAVDDSMDRLRRVLTTLPLPSERVVRARAAEGFACYALYPEQYVDAARQIAAGDEDRPIVCVGIRSIGAVLAAVVAATLRRAGRPVATRTVRPRGHPYDRTLPLGPRLERFLSSAVSSSFIVVDEGPGISGSSFAAVTDALMRLGVTSERITLVPAWRCNPLALRSDRARDIFSQCRVVVGNTPVEGKARLAAGDGLMREMSAGLWRPVVLGDRVAWPAVQPQHERVKYVTTGAGTSTLARFAGLGRRGSSKLTRAGVLHEGGFGPCPVRFADGFVVREWTDGRPLTEVGVDGPIIQRIADYIAFTRQRFTLNEPDRGDDIADMFRQNAIEALGDRCSTAVNRLIDTRAPCEAPLVAVDGRLLPHEWIAPSDDRIPLMKVDALDHHADDFLPGCRDIAWDVAGACVELQLSGDAQERLLDRYVRLTGDRGIRERLPFFAGAYIAYRLGYATLAVELLGDTPDGRRFTELRERYRRSLAAHVARPHPAAAR